MRQLLQRSDFVAQERLGKHPALVGVELLRPDERHAAALVVFPDTFARATPAYAGSDDEIIALNHLGKAGR